MFALIDQKLWVHDLIVRLVHSNDVQFNFNRFTKFELKVPMSKCFHDSPSQMALGYGGIYRSEAKNNKTCEISNQCSNEECQLDDDDDDDMLKKLTIPYYNRTLIRSIICSTSKPKEIFIILPTEARSQYIILKSNHFTEKHRMYE